MNSYGQQRGSYSPQDNSIAIRDLVAKGLSGSNVDLIKYAEEIGRKLDSKNSISSSQARKYFDVFKKISFQDYSVKRFEEVNELELLMLKPHLNYSSNRQSAKLSLDFKTLVEQLIDYIVKNKTDEAKMKRCVCFFEAIYGYTVKK